MVGSTVMCSASIKGLGNTITTELRYNDKSHNRSRPFTVEKSNTIKFFQDKVHFYE